MTAAIIGLAISLALFALLAIFHPWLALVWFCAALIGAFIVGPELRRLGEEADQ